MTQKKKICPHSEGKGYIELRDCVGDIQREETCSFCGGTGEIILEKSDEFEINSNI